MSGDTRKEGTMSDQLLEALKRAEPSLGDTYSPVTFDRLCDAVRTLVAKVYEQEYIIVKSGLRAKVEMDDAIVRAREYGP